MKRKYLIKFNLPWPFYLIFIAIWLIVASYILGYWNYLNPAGEWKTITNEQYHFSVEYPTKWSAQIYGERGFKGTEEVKLRIYRSRTSFFTMRVLQENASNPTSNDVAEWGKDRIEQINRNIAQSRSLLNEIDFREDFINGKQVFVRRYGNGEFINEDVYIARENDMIIILLQSEASDFDQYLEDFYRIVDSFRTVD